MFCGFELVLGEISNIAFVSSCLAGLSAITFFASAIAIYKRNSSLFDSGLISYSYSSSSESFSEERLYDSQLLSSPSNFFFSDAGLILTPNIILSFTDFFNYTHGLLSLFLSSGGILALYITFSFFLFIVASFNFHYRYCVL